MCRTDTGGDWSAVACDRSENFAVEDQAERIANGDLQNPCHTTDTDEVGMVTNSLGRMTVQLDSMINEVYKMEIEKKNPN